MAIAVIEWIRNGKNYDEGAALYQRIGTSDYLKKLFATGRTTITARKLETELLKLKETAPKPKPKRATTSTRTKPQLVKKKPKYIIDLEKKWKQHYKEGNDLRYFFKDRLKNNELQPSRESREIALKILDKRDVFTTCWAKIDEYNATGIIPEATTDPFSLRKMSLREIFQREKNLHTYITKCSKIISKSDDAKQLEKKTEQLEKHQHELAAISAYILELDKINGYVV